MWIGGREREFKYPINSIRSLIHRTGRTPAQIMQGGFDPTDFDLGVYLIWGALLWENPKLTPETVGEWLDLADGVYGKAVVEAAQALMRTFERQFGAGDEDVQEQTGEDESKN